MLTSEITVAVGGKRLTCLLAEPERLAAKPALVMNFASDRRSSMFESPYDIPVRAFIAAGHRALSFDLPSHGDNILPGRSEGIADCAKSLVAGDDPFARFVVEGQVVIDEMVRRDLATPGRIFVAGTSRGGYCALRLMAADPRIGGGAAYAPVTDWRVLQEFAAARDRQNVAALALPHFAAPLAGRPVWFAIGNADARVGTDACLRFALALAEAESTLGVKSSRLQFHVVPESGHSLSEPWRGAGAQFLLECASSAE